MALTTVNPAMIGQTSTGAASLTATGSASASLITAAGTALSANSSGYITTPYQPKFRATVTSPITGIADQGAIIFNNAVTNVGSCYNTSNGRFTAPVAGVYQFNVVFLYQNVSVGQACEASFFLNGANSGGMSFGPRVKYQTDYTGYNGYVSMSGSFCMYLNAGDYVTVNSIAGRTFEIYGSASNVWSNFSGFLIG